MEILGLLDMYFEVAVEFVIKFSLLFRLALAIYCGFVKKPNDFISLLEHNLIVHMVMKILFSILGNQPWWYWYWKWLD